MHSSEVQKRLTTRGENMGHWKTVAICLVILAALWDLFLDALSLRSERNPTPENVKDVYDAEEYQKWRQYHREGIIADSTFDGIDSIITLLLIIFNVPAIIAASLNNTYWAAIAVLLADTISALLHIRSMSLLTQWSLSKSMALTELRSRHFGRIRQRTLQSH